MGVGALIGAVVGGAAFAAGSTLLGTTLVSSALMGAALGSIFDRRPIQPESPTYAFGPWQNTRSAVIPVPVIYGRVRVAGNIIYHRVTDDQKRMYMCVAIGEGEINGVSDIRVNDTPIEQIKGAEWRVYRGTADQQADPWVHTGERWPYTAYLALKFAANDQISSTPTITCVVEGRRVPVWTGTGWVTQYTNNPAWCLLDFLRSRRYGVGIEDSRIDFDSFLREAQYCDEMVLTEDGRYEPRFELDYVIDYERPSLDVLEDILATFRAYLLYSDGKLRLKVEKSEAPVYHFSMDNIVEGSFVYSRASRRDVPNQIRIEWIDPSADYERAEAVYDNEVDQQERGEVYSRTISLLGVTRASQAGRMARFYHDSAYWARTFCEFKVGIDALHVEVGDIVQVSHEVPGWDRKLFRILEIQEEESDEAKLICREYVPIIYHDRGVAYQPGKQTTLPNPVAPPPHVTNLSVTEASRIVGDGTVVPVIRVTWTEPVAAFYAGAIVYWRRVGEAAWQRSELSEAPSYDIILAEPGQYQVRVVSQNRNGVRAPFDTAPEATITVSTVIPGDVTGLRVEFSGPDAVINWNPVPRAYRYRLQILDPATDLVKRSEEIAGTTYRYTYAQNAADFGGNGSPTIKVSVEARNEAGNYSRQPAIVQATCPVLPRPEVTVRSDRAEIRWVVTSEVGATWRSTTVSVGTFTQTAPVLSGVIDAESAGLSDGDLATVVVRLNDVFGRSSEPREVQVTVKYIDKLAFAQSIRPVELVSALPRLPNPEYPQGAIVFLTTDNQLYRSTGTEWVVEVPAEVLDGSITAAKLAAGAVTSDKLAANAVTAGKIAVGAVGADAIAARAIRSHHLEAGVLSVGNIEGIQGFQEQTIQLAAQRSEPRIVKAPVPPSDPREGEYWHDTSPVAAYEAWSDTVGADETKGFDETTGWDETESAAVVFAALFGEPSQVETLGNILYRRAGNQWVPAADRTAEHYAKDQHNFNVLPGVAGGGAVRIDSSGAWGYDAQGNRRAGFGTDGRWIAGGGRVVADERGVIINDGTNERIHQGDISGRPWGSGTLGAGTYGIWGDRAGLYLRGYTRLLMVASGLDEEIVDLSGFPNLANPVVIVLPKELVSYSPERATLSHLYVDAVRLDATRWRLKAKTLVKGATVDWGSRGNQRAYWEHVRPVNADPINGRKGVWTNFLICRPRWWVSGGGFGLYTARLWMDITNQFDANGDPINWQTIRTFSTSSGGEGTLNWDTSVPYGQWAMRVRGQGDGSLLVSYAETGLAASGYRTGDTYLRVDGTVITDPDPGNVPSGMSVVYFAVDQG
ncbi:MAG: hypothetical protein BAA04_04905 [Firmicutes bacterium ZCTH02-B6]|nr:MAG: hypothetical protein BAA04_04905 [Firmicutes bacterium ZCTH02-B6]